LNTFVFVEEEGELAFGAHSHPANGAALWALHACSCLDVKCPFFRALEDTVSLMKNSGFDACSTFRRCRSETPDAELVAGFAFLVPDFFFLFKSVLFDFLFMFGCNFGFLIDWFSDIIFVDFISVFAGTFSVLVLFGLSWEWTGNDLGGLLFFLSRGFALALFALVSLFALVRFFGLALVGFFGLALVGFFGLALVGFFFVRLL
jgi:hypothetical protein